MAVTLSYMNIPGQAASATAPTATQAFRMNSLNVSVIKSADGDTTATIVHNMALTAAQLAAGFPKIILSPRLLKFWTIVPFVASQTANQVVITMATTGGGGDAAVQFICTIERPMSKTK